MQLLDTKYKRKSAAITTVIGIVVLILIFIFGLSYYDPPKEYGIAVNFGTTDFGSGNVQPKEALKPASQIQETEPIVEEVIEEEVAQEQTAVPTESSEASEDVITQNTEDAIAIKKQEEFKRKEEELKKIEADRQAEADKKADEERKRVAAENKRIEKEKQEKAAKRKSADDLFKGFDKTDGNASGGEGDDNKPGDKGKPTGDPNANRYYGIGGGGNGGNYQLGNRKALSKPKPTYDCNEEGKVVVSILVDKSGNVISATPGVKGSNITVDCLLSRAKEAALKTKFSPDPKAELKQMGTIIYNFTISK